MSSQSHRITQWAYAAMKQDWKTTANRAKRQVLRTLFYQKPTKPGQTTQETIDALAESVVAGAKVSWWTIKATYHLMKVAAFPDSYLRKWAGVDRYGNPIEEVTRPLEDRNPSAAVDSHANSHQRNNSHYAHKMNARVSRHVANVIRKKPNPKDLG